ncbi:MAG TPA: hypothetical protein VGQ62_17420 [Chloroflexota bacterium]|nr:hypothetical protein [Chloroflexota bacterium]
MDVLLEWENSPPSVSEVNIPKGGELVRQQGGVGGQQDTGIDLQEQSEHRRHTGFGQHHEMQDRFLRTGGALDICATMLGPVGKAGDQPDGDDEAEQRPAGGLVETAHAAQIPRFSKDRHRPTSAFCMPPRGPRPRV